MLDHLDAQDLYETLPDPEVVTYLVRTSTAVPDTADSWAAYTLYNVTRRPATRDDLRAAGVGPGVVVSDEFAVFWVWQRDLDLAVAYQAQPFVSYQLFDQSAGLLSGNVSQNQQTVTAITPSTAGLLPGMAVAGNGVAPGSLVQSVDSASQVTLTRAATAAQNGAQLAFGAAWVVEAVERHQTRARWELTCRKGR